MKQYLKNGWPLPAAMGLFALLTAFLLWRSLKGTAGLLTYPLDDTYIHLAHARNLALHHIWGVTSHEFSSSSSSLLWTLLLAAAWRFTSAPEWLPLAFNFIFGLGVLTLLDRWFASRIAGRTARFFLLAFVLLLVPLPVMALSGMEHMLQILLVAAIVLVLDAALRRDPLPAAYGWGLAGLAIALAMTRFEGLFVVAAAGLVLIATRRWKTGLGLWMAGWIPATAYGLYSLGHGGWFLPNTLLLKGTVPGASLRGLAQFASESCNKLQKEGAIQTLLLMALVLLVLTLARPGRRRPGVALLMFFIGTLVPHILFAQFGLLVRYEAYLVTMGAMVLTAAACALALELREWSWPLKLALAGLALAVVAPFKGHFIDAMRYTPVASRNIHEQQYQMARFARQYFPDEAVAVNDIGYVSYVANPRLLDLWGLASQAVAQAKRHKVYDSRMMDELARARGVRWAMVYDSWFYDRQKLPQSWVKAGQWVIRDNYVCGSDTVSFYAVQPDFAPRLRAGLKAFASQLPPKVGQSGPYLD